jgi:hypothetical protein
MALLERSRSGKGQVIDAAMVDGVAYLSAFQQAAMTSGAWRRPRGRNLLDGGAPFYRVYACAPDSHDAVNGAADAAASDNDTADAIATTTTTLNANSAGAAFATDDNNGNGNGENIDEAYMAVGCLEPQFYTLFVRGLLSADCVRRDKALVKQLQAIANPLGGGGGGGGGGGADSGDDGGGGGDGVDVDGDSGDFNYMDEREWPRMQQWFAKALALQSRRAWTNVFADIDACVTPVLSIAEAVSARNVTNVTMADGASEPAPAPRLHRTPALAAR